MKINELVKFRKSRKFRNSLTSRYLMIIMIALLFLQISLPFTALIYFFYENLTKSSESVQGKPYPDALALEKMWHQEAKNLDGRLGEQINESLLRLWQTYPHSKVFWVDRNNKTQLRMPDQGDIPEVWNTADIISFMKKYTDADPFTVVAFIGDQENKGQGFMVFQLPRELMKGSSVAGNNTAFYGIAMSVMFVLFIAISWLFFSRIRRRLLRLESAMTAPRDNGIPAPIELKKRDEIGQLEAAFNHMIEQLEESRQREQEEEQLRKQLIASLSHDLRTPLTVIRSHLYSLQKEQLTEQGTSSLALMEMKISDLATLIDNLLSYNLLTSGRYTLSLETRDVLRIVREGAAAWYPVWEKEHFEVDINLEDDPLMWSVDEQWFRRILDNLFQNIVRHAKTGRYIGIWTEKREGGAAILIADHGQGMDAASQSKGAGIGLAIVDFLVKEMRLCWEVDSSEKGTTVILYHENLNKI
ncbi:HAMP domain-containing sensor histidine kinase [Paenibacillus sediminis]|uniref:histidine kinase n=1 Tax=Paenibacillus sediminis TaxID=664909 RepID=A0ABS4H339_9BACL|nr:HAMP domain-containing sensor histidine kinase [Paenibacillus sediminis]MBP1936933.1 signal transduction histidine kinase [Paenibacillus sediminis]